MGNRRRIYGEKLFKDFFSNRYMGISSYFIRPGGKVSDLLESIKNGIQVFHFETSYYNSSFIEYQSIRSRSRYPVFSKPRRGEILQRGSVAAGMLSGQYLSQGNRWNVEEERVLVDTPFDRNKHLETCPYSRSFEEEGIPSPPLVLFENEVSSRVCRALHIRCTSLYQAWPAVCIRAHT